MNIKLAQILITPKTAQGYIYTISDYMNLASAAKYGNLKHPE